MSIHVAGIIGLALIFAIGTLRPVNLGALALVATFLVAVGWGELSLADAYRGFPVDLLVLLVAVTYLFALAARNGTIDWLVGGAARLVRGHRALLPWIVFAVAAVPTTAGALGSAGVALIAPVALRLAEHTGIDRRLIALMVLHGAACGNFSPINVLGALVHRGAADAGVHLAPASLFLANVACNVALGAVVYFLFGGHRLARTAAVPTSSESVRSEVAAAVPLSAQPAPPSGARIDRVATLLGLAVVAAGSLSFGLNVGVAALVTAVTLHLLFPSALRGAERDIAWDVVLLVCGVVTYVAALQSLGTVAAIGQGIAGLGSPLLGALLLCAVGALASAFASSAGIIGAMMVLAAPFIATGGTIDPAGLIVALAICITVVDACPFSTAGALVVANTRAEERGVVYRALLIWGAIMVAVGPPLACLLFIAPGG